MPRKPPPGKSLAEVNPELAKEWHPTKNGDLTPMDVYSSQAIKVWWKCPIGNDHEWVATINNRKKGSNCAICSNRVAVFSNCLATLNPKLAQDWHHTKNGDLTPYDIVPNSNKKVWWKCDKGPDHEWESAVSKRTFGRGCPICAGKIIVKSNCLETTHPELSREWHPTKNGDLTPKNISFGSHKKVWWKCDKGPDHEWESNTSNRAKGSGCPVCTGQKVVLSNCLETTHPELSREWHPTKNGDLTPKNVHAGSTLKAWWKCPEGDDHIWLATINSRQRLGCPICSNRKVVLSNCLETTHPELAREWHPTKNAALTPYDIVANSNKKVWWKCPKGDDHEWKTSVAARTNLNTGCPGCSGRVVVLSNSLAVNNPLLAQEWHPTKNGALTPFQVHFGSHESVWWKCPKGDDHEWKTQVSDRKSGSKCPFCILTPQSRQELIITFELLTIFKGINPKGFKTRVNGKLWSIDTFIPSLNVGIEFDGAYWHKDKAQLDKVKTEKIEETGLNLIRVRQKPLERLFEDDVMAEKKFDGKQITNDILKQIVKDDGKYAYKLNKRTLDKIDKYLKLEGLQNEKGLDKYIDQILTEKAERKK